MWAAMVVFVDEQVHEHLWWRTSEAYIMRRDGVQGGDAGVLVHLRCVALHKPVDSANRFNPTPRWLTQRVVDSVKSCWHWRVDCPIFAWRRPS